MKKTNCITITYLAKVSLASLNGADKEVDNINPIKKVTLANGEELPYVSSQAIRRALRDRLVEMGFSPSPIKEREKGKSASATSGAPVEYMEDDLFGYMSAEKAGTFTRTSPIRVEALIGMSTYKGDLDFGTNYMGKSVGATPNIFETEIHAGYYRGTILIELDRIGIFTHLEGKEFSRENPKVLAAEEKIKRVKAFLEAFQNLWSSGRQTRFLADISPKFMAAAYMTAKNPVFMEAVKVDENGTLNLDELETVVQDYGKFMAGHVFAAQGAIFPLSEGLCSLKKGFETLDSWVEEYYKANP